MPNPIYGPTNPDPQEKSNPQPRRFASVVELRSEKEAYYRELHADVWRTVLDRIRKSNFRNYSIHLGEIDGKKLLFSYCEYIGDDLDADSRAIGEDPETQRWWKETDPCQRPLAGENASKEDWWMDLEEVFYTP